jgi:hypothetical protein
VQSGADCVIVKTIVVQKVLQKNENNFTAEDAEEGKTQIEEGQAKDFFRSQTQVILSEAQSLTEKSSINGFD